MGRILIVEDDDSWKGILSRTLTRAGYEVFVATDRRTALDLFRSKEPDLITMDGQLGEGRNHEKGLDIAAEIRKLHPSLPIVMVSANRDTLTFEDRGISKRDFNSEVFLSLIAGLVDG